MAAGTGQGAAFHVVNGTLFGEAWKSFCSPTVFPEQRIKDPEFPIHF